MQFKDYLLIIVIASVVLLIAASIQDVPGYMDADYYFLGGRQLAMGRGFSEPILWNYLDDPVGLPHPSHSYWMPLASILASFGMRLRGEFTFSASRLAFIILALLVPPLTTALSYQLSGSRKQAFTAGILAVFSGYYLPYAITTDTFTIMMFLGVTLFLIIPKDGSISYIRVFVVGLLAGLLHLTRADGLFWLPLLILIFFWVNRSQKTENLKWLGFLIIGYFVVMAPWIYRNLSVFGTPLAPGGMKTLWSTTYDQIFSFPSDQLTFQKWISTGIWQILKDRFWALGINLQRTLAEQGIILLFPLIILGMWRSRSDLKVQIGFWTWLLTFGVMTFVFPFAGARGGLFHSCSALQPLFWATAPIGLNIFVEWGNRSRGWLTKQAWGVFATGLVGITVLLTGFIFYERVIGSDPGTVSWEKSSLHYIAIEKALKEFGAIPEDVVMTINPPGYAIANMRYSIAIPDGDVNTLLAVADRYNVKYVILEFDHPKGLDNLYQVIHNTPPELRFLRSVDDTHIFSIE